MIQISQPGTKVQKTVKTSQNSPCDGYYGSAEATPFYSSFVLPYSINLLCVYKLDTLEIRKNQ